MPRRKRFKILLDEMLPGRHNFSLLNNLHNVRHITHDLKLSGISDDEIIKLARSEESIIVTKNVRHFKEKSVNLKVDLIGITETIPIEDLDKLLVANIKKLGHRMTGKYIKIARPIRKK